MFTNFLFICSLSFISLSWPSCINSLQLDRKPSKCVVFEDDPRGIAAAHNCTMMAVGLIGAHPACVLKHLPMEFLDDLNWVIRLVVFFFYQLSNWLISNGFNFSSVLKEWFVLKILLSLTQTLLFLLIQTASPKVRLLTVISIPYDLFYWPKTRDLFSEVDLELLQKLMHSDVLDMHL